MVDQASTMHLTLFIVHTLVKIAVRYLSFWCYLFVCLFFNCTHQAARALQFRACCHGSCCSSAPNSSLIIDSFRFPADGQSYTVYHPFFNGIFSFAVFVRGQMVEGFPLDINIGDIGPRARSAKKAIAGSGSKFGRLGDPQGVAVDQDGHVIVSDSRNHRLQVSARIPVKP